MGVVTFDIADGTFEFYTDKMWEVQLQEWRDDLEADGCEDVAELQAEELMECFYGEEMFFDRIPDTLKQFLT